MPKSLGQIHTANFSLDVGSSTEYHTLDLSGALTSQLNEMVRQGQTFKVVGVDMNLATQGTLGGGQISGKLMYYAPTRGRCEAYRNAYKAMMNAMKLQGVNHRANKQYDFRVGFNGLETNPLADGGSLENQATLNGTDPLTLAGAGNPTADSSSVFVVHNASVQPDTTSATNLFPAGFNTMGVQNTPTDFVLNDSVLYSGNSMTASTAPEAIPFMLSWTPDTTDLSIGLEWRPDPALYLAIMAGQFQVFIEEVNLDGGAGGLELQIAVHVSGWKSIMGSKSKKTSRRRKSSSKRRSKRRS